MGTLACDDGEQISAHKIILSSSSGVFEKILAKNPDKHMLLYLRGLSVNDLKSLLQFIYLGEVNLEENKVDEFLMIASEFQVRGLENKMMIESGLDDRHNREKLSDISNVNIEAANVLTIKDEAPDGLSVENVVKDKTPKKNRSISSKIKILPIEKSGQSEQCESEPPTPTKDVVTAVTRIIQVKGLKRKSIGIGDK